MDFAISADLLIENESKRKVDENLDLFRKLKKEKKLWNRKVKVINSNEKNS